MIHMTKKIFKKDPVLEDANFLAHTRASVWVCPSFLISVHFVCILHLFLLSTGASHVPGIILRD